MSQYGCLWISNKTTDNDDDVFMYDDLCAF